MSTFLRLPVYNDKCRAVPLHATKANGREGDTAVGAQCTSKYVLAPFPGASSLLTQVKYNKPARFYKRTRPAC